jgi:hypothetical protein
MTIAHVKFRRWARRVARFGLCVSAIAMTVSGWAVVSSAVAGAAGVSAGAGQVVKPAGAVGAGQPLTDGGSATSFSLKLPSGAACAADGNNGGRWHTYMVPGTENPANVTFAGNGSLVGSSVGSGGTGVFRNSLYNTTGVPVRGQAPNLGDAAVINIPNMRFSVWSNGNIPPGVYSLGIACVDLDLGSAMDHYWNTQLLFEADATDPVGVRWTTSTAATTTTTTTTSTPSSTSTSAPTSSTSTTTPTTTSQPPTTTTSTTTTSAPPAATATTLSASALATTTTAPPTPTPGGQESTPSVLGNQIIGSAPPSVAGSSGELPALGATGMYAQLFIVSAAFLLVFGRILVLLGRRTVVYAETSR